MFRNSLRRCSTAARSATTVSILSQSRTAFPIAKRQVAPVFSAIAPLSRLASISRAYSTETASAPAEDAAVKSETVNFADLEDIHTNLQYAITRGMGFKEMTPVQAKTIVPALKGTDIVAQAKTGTGKTLAFLLPVLQRMINEDPSLAHRSSKHDARSDDIRGIVLSPTRELAEQIAVEARRLTKGTGLVVQCAVGGTDKRGMLQRTRREGCHLLIATPGRLNDLLQDTRSHIGAPNLAALVLDEADRMLDVGFEKELNEITDALPSPSEKVRQTMLVSATIPDNVIRLARTMVRSDDFEFVQTIPENESLTHDNVPQHIAPIRNWTNVFPSLFELIDREVAKCKEDPNGRPFKAIVYLNTTSLVELAGEVARERRRNLPQGVALPSYVLQSKLSQPQRQRAADGFRATKTGILLSSDVTARGMDFPDVTHVIQIDTPRDRESYIHRLGRTGRQGKEGEGWLLIPHASIPHARKLLRGLPINQNGTLEASEIDAMSGETTPIHDEMKSLFNLVPRSVLVSTYTSMFGTAADKVELAGEVNEWTSAGWGWQEPPSVSQKWINLMGLARAQGMNVTDNVTRTHFSNDRDDNRDSRRVRRGSRFREPRDQFDLMRQNIVRDDGGDRGSGGRSWGGRGTVRGERGRNHNWGATF